MALDADDDDATDANANGNGSCRCRAAAAAAASVIIQLLPRPLEYFECQVQWMMMLASLSLSSISWLRLIGRMGELQERLIALA